MPEGIDLPAPGSLFGMIVFGAIGMAAFVYGKKNAQAKPMIIGVILMVYPYFFSETWLVYLVGAALTAALFMFRE